MALQYRESVQRLRAGMEIAVVIDGLHPMLERGTPRSFRVISETIAMLEEMLSSDMAADKMFRDAHIVLSCAQVTL